MGASPVLNVAHGGADDDVPPICLHVGWRWVNLTRCCPGREGGAQNRTAVFLILVSGNYSYPGSTRATCRGAVGRQKLTAILGTCCAVAPAIARAMRVARSSMLEGWLHGPEETKCSSLSRPRKRSLLVYSSGNARVRELYSTLFFAGSCARVDKTNRRQYTGHCTRTLSSSRLGKGFGW